MAARRLLQCVFTVRNFPNSFLLETTLPLIAEILTVAIPQTTVLLILAWVSTPFVFLLKRCRVSKCCGVDGLCMRRHTVMGNVCAKFVLKS